ncbi:uncharacterized protein ACNS7B_006908 [Menidia menidia]
MRLTALCVCGTLLAFSSLSRAAAGRDAPPEDGEPGPCEATLRPGGACGPGQRGGSCPYLFSLPPLTLHLPLQLRELEKITQDLERLKESVDQLREMCADCKVSQTYGRECGRQKEGERERLGTGGEAGEDGREWMNERLDEKDLRKECGNAGGHAVEEKDLKGEADRKSNTKVVKENEEEETWTVAEKDGITKTGSEREKGPSVQRKVPASGANERIDDAMREKSNQNSDTNSNKTDAGEENSNRHQEDKLTTTVENKRKAEESGHHEWRDETNSNEKKTQPEFSDRKKLFENHGEHTNKEPRLRGEEMEEGIKVHRNNEKPKQTVTTGWAEKESVIKEGQLDEEGRERGKEMKTESEQRDGDGETSTSRATQRADSSPINPTARSNKATFFSSFVPLPSLVSPTLSSIADVPRDTIGVYGPTQSTSLKAAGFSEPRSPGAELTTVGGRAEQITSITARSDSASKVRPGSRGHFSSTTTTPKITTPHQNLYVTAFSEAADSSRSTPKMNVSSKTKTGVKPLPGKGPKPGERRNHGDSPEAERTLKNAKNVRKPDQAPHPDKKPKYKPKQKPSHHKPTSHKSKPGKHIQISNPDQTTPPYLLKTDNNLKTNSTPKNNQVSQSKQNQLPVQKAQSHKKSPTSVQKPISLSPEMVNTTNSDKDFLSSREDVSDRVPITDPKSKPAKKIIQPKPVKLDQKAGKKTQSQENTKPGEKLEMNPDPTYVPRSGRKIIETTTFKSQTNFKHLTESADKSNKNPPQEPTPNPDSTKGQKSSLPYKAPDQKNTSDLEIYKTEQKPKHGPEHDTERNKTVAPKRDHRPLTELENKPNENPPHESNVSADSTPAQKPDSPYTHLNENPKPGQGIPMTDRKPQPGQVKNKTATLTPAPKLLMDIEDKSDEILSHESKFNPGEEIKNNPSYKPPHLRPKSVQEIPKVDRKPKAGQELAKNTTAKPTQQSLTDLVDKIQENLLNTSKSYRNSSPQQESDPSPKPLSEKPTPGQEIPVTKPKTRPDPGSSILEPTEIDQKPKSGQEPELVRNITVKPKPNQKSFTDLVASSNEFETNRDSSPGQESDPSFKPPDQRLKSLKDIPITDRKPKPGQKTEFVRNITASAKPNQRPLMEIKDKTHENPTNRSASNRDAPAEKIKNDFSDKPHYQKPKSIQEISQIDGNPKPGQEQESKENLTVTPKPNQNPSNVSESNKDSKTSEKSNLLCTSPDQRPKSVQEITKIDQKPKAAQEPESARNKTAATKLKQRPLTGTVIKSNKNQSESKQDSTKKKTPGPVRSKKPLVQKTKPGHVSPKINLKPKTSQVSKQNKKYPKSETGSKTKLDSNPKTEHTPRSNPSLGTSEPSQTPPDKPVSVPDRAPKAESNKTSILEPPSRYGAVGPGAKPIPRPKLAEQPKPNQKNKTYSDPPQVGRATLDPVQNTQTNVPPTSGLVKRIAGTTRSPEDAGLGAGVRKGVAPAPKTSNSPEAAFEDSTLSPDSGMASDLRPQTTARPSAIPTTARPNRIHLPTVISGTSPASTQPGLRPHSPSSTHAETLHNMKDKTPSATAAPSPGPQTASKLLPDFRPLTPATSSPEPPAAEPSTPGARELRVKINQVPAFPDSRGGPEEQPGGTLPGPGSDRANGKLPTSVSSKEPSLYQPTKGNACSPQAQYPMPIQFMGLFFFYLYLFCSYSTVRRDCSDHLRRGETKSGVYLVTPDLRSRSFPVVCDMERDGGGWTLLQRRQDGSVSFDRTWAEYQSGFGNLDGGEFWLGNNKIHWLTRDRDMVLRVELEDFNGVAEHAQYDQFRVAGERLRYRLTVGGYSGTAGDALRFSKTYDHNNRAFTTPDRDHDRYPSGNCGAYYSSGWWFDACMAANLNGKYYVGTYKGVRNGIFWGTWHNISTEYYPTNERQSFKTVRMMIRPKGFAP